jgi:peptidoglycan/LPS O-acetylase OafA/YrhL
MSLPLLWDSLFSLGGEVESAMEAKSSNLGYVPALDGMRGFAVFAVMLFHANMPFMKGGFIGVDVFFVLSGFLITSLLIREFNRQQRIDLRNFYLRRVLRLGPALVLFLVSFASISALVLDADKGRSNLVDTLIALFYFSNWAWAFQIHPPNFLAHTWSLSIEEQFYILWPILLIALLRFIRSHKNIIKVIILLAVSTCLIRVFLAVTGSSIDRLYNGLDTRADALLVGCMLGVLLSSNIINEYYRSRLEKLLKFFAPLSAMGLILLGVFMRWQDIYFYCWWLSVVEVLSGIVILDTFVSQESVVKDILSLKLFIWIGSISYGLYLWHFPIYKAMRLLGFHRLGILTIGTGFTLLVASLSYYFLERPVVKLKIRLAPHTPNHSLPLRAIPLPSPAGSKAGTRLKRS